MITDALLVTQDAERRIVRGDLRIEQGRFTHVGPHAPKEGAESIDGRGFAAVPGFINTHGHVAMAPLRGIADDRDLGGFLDVLFRLDADRTEADVEAGARAGSR
ncbi:hydroxydechloroatrazine ethylaminohydrolase, partial [mine drainage metagenome]